MYSNKGHLNTLTALLVAHGVQHAVVCPGSRNAPIAHNLVACPDIECHSVADERSAGFYALGLSLATACPVAVCVTSGTALLNLLPAVAEARYQHVPLVVISADRPPQWIDQLDGQTLPQADALGRFVSKAVTLPEFFIIPQERIAATPHPSSPEEGNQEWCSLRSPLLRGGEVRGGGGKNDQEELHWHCNRLANEALLATRRHGGGPVHINVPLTEPLYDFTVKTLPQERTIFMATSCSDRRQLSECADNFLTSQKPMIVVGQTPRDTLRPGDFAGIGPMSVVLNESLSIGCGSRHFDEVLAHGSLPPEFTPDFVLVLGDTLVSKRLKQFLRQLPADVPVWAVSEDGEVHDTFQHLSGLIEGHPADVLADLTELAAPKHAASTKAFVDRWEQLLAKADEAIGDFHPDYSQIAAVKMLEAELGGADGAAVHYGNSTAVRLANVYARHYVFCNRGVNGIEGTLSTAAGFSLATAKTVFCVLGDLSFFYDGNALWNRDLQGNLRILLLNNGGGGIFERFDGLRESPARERFVMAKHQTSAEGLCQSYGVSYRPAHDMAELEAGIRWLTAPSPRTSAGERPLLLEVFTDSAADNRVMQAYEARFRSMGKP